MSRTQPTFEIAQLLVKDDQDLIHKATGGWIRKAEISYTSSLLAFPDKNAAIMPRTLLLSFLMQRRKNIILNLAIKNKIPR